MPALPAVGIARRCHQTKVTGHAHRGRHAAAFKAAGRQLRFILDEKAPQPQRLCPDAGKATTASCPRLT